MKRNAEIIMKVATVILVLAIFYMGISLYIPLPMPKWYEEMRKYDAEARVNQNPIFKLTKEAVTLRIERDSLQHLVDSLQLKK